MLKVNTIKKGIVIDHIEAGLGSKIYNYLGLDKVDYSVALIKNVHSRKMGKKDIIKIDNNMDIDFNVLGLISPSITINIVDDETIERKLKLELPEKVENIISCKNPRCITQVEKYVPQTFKLTNREKATYRCEYCDEVSRFSES